MMIKNGVEILRQNALESIKNGTEFPYAEAVLTLIETIDQFAGATPDTLQNIINEYNADPEGEQMYFLLAKDHSQGNLFAVWWRHDNHGYTTDLNQAGRYTESQIQAQPDYYDNDDTVPILVEEVLKQHFMKQLEMNVLHRRFGIDYSKTMK